MTLASEQGRWDTGRPDLRSLARCRKELVFLFSSGSMRGAPCRMDLRAGFWSSDFPRQPQSPSAWVPSAALGSARPSRINSYHPTTLYKSLLLLWNHMALLSESCRWQRPYVAMYVSPTSPALQNRGSSLRNSKIQPRGYQSPITRDLLFSHCPKCQILDIFIYTSFIIDFVIVVVRMFLFLYFT